MIRAAEKPVAEVAEELALTEYQLHGSPRRREGGSLLFAAIASDGGPATVQVSAQPVSNRRIRARFRRLARVRAELDHPALIEVREVGEEGGRPFVATERFPARSLADLLREGALDPGEAVRLLKLVAGALDTAHAAGLVHRTLGPESVLLDGDRAKLDLFGLFTAVGQPAWGDVVRRDAHLHYESPEGVRGEELGAASNVYSLTGLLFHALTGQKPFAHHDPVAITYAHVSQPPPKPSECRARLPKALDAVVARGMAKEPGDRPESAGALIATAATVLRTASYSSPEFTPRTAVSPSPGPPPAAVAPAPAAVTPVAAADAAPRWRRPLGARLAPFGPLALVLVLAAALGALLGMPGAPPEQTAGTARSADERAAARLDEVRFRLRDEFALAATADEQAGVADRLAFAYGRAADSLDSPELVSAAQSVSVAYIQLAEAAREGEQEKYEQERGRVEAAEAEIAAELSSAKRPSR